MPNESDKAGRPKVRGIYLLPNLFTLGALFSGFYAIIAATHHHFDVSATAIFIAMILDALDGRIARLTNTQSEFGAQMDSLSDMVCFGLTPALVLYTWSLSTLGKPGWLVAFFYTVCTALRLARFNAQSQNENKRYFKGISTTAAAGFVASLIWVATEYGVSGIDLTWVIAGITVVVSLLKVSTVRYRSFKDTDFKGRVPFIVIFLVVLTIVLISYDPPTVCFVGFSLYLLSGPLEMLGKLLRLRRTRRA